MRNSSSSVYSNTVNRRHNVDLASQSIFHIDQDDDKWWTKLGACKWLKCVSRTLHGAASLAKLLNFKNIELAGK